MSEVLSVLVHPQRWKELQDVSLEARLTVAALLLAGSMLVAWVSGSIVGRWAAARGAAFRVGSPGKLRRSAMWLPFFLGAYGAVEVAPVPEKIERVVAGILFVAGVIVASRLVREILLVALETSAATLGGEERQRLEKQQIPVVAKVVHLVVFLTAVVLVMKHFGQDVSSVVAALGLGSLAIGLAAQQTLGNMFAGFVLIFDRPFRIGDTIKLASGAEGEVLEIGVRSTRILTVERHVLIVPNTEVANSRVFNLTVSGYHGRVDVHVVIAHGKDTERTAELMTAIAREAKRRASEPSIAVGTSVAGVDIGVSFDVDPRGAVSASEQDVRRRLLARLDEAGIELARSF